MSQGARDGGANMFMDERYVAVPWMARSGACPWKDGISQGAEDGGVIVTWEKDYEYPQTDIC